MNDVVTWLGYIGRGASDILGGADLICRMVNLGDLVSSGTMRTKISGLRRVIIDGDSDNFSSVFSHSGLRTAIHGFDLSLSLVHILRIQTEIIFRRDIVSDVSNAVNFGLLARPLV